MAKILLYATIVLVPVLAFVFAKGARGFGRQIALARMTNTASVKDTIDRQVRFSGKTGLLAILFVVGVVALLLFTPSGAESWAPLLGSVVGFAANLALGLSAGVGSHVADILARPEERDTIDAMLDMKRRTRRHLQKFIIPAVFSLVTLLGAGDNARAANRTWPWAIDISDSVDPAQREMGLDNMIKNAVDNAHKLGADTIVIIKFSDEELLSDMAWVPVPPIRIHEDCKLAEAPPMFSKSLVMFSPSLASGRKRAAVEHCLAQQEVDLRSQAEEEQRFQEQLRIAARVTPRSDGTTRIVPLLQSLTSRPYVCAVDVLTDLIDTSGISPSVLRIPEHIPVTIIVTRPNPKRWRPTLSQVLAAAVGWAKIKGVNVTSASEYPGYVHPVEAR